MNLRRMGILWTLTVLFSVGFVVKPMGQANTSFGRDSDGENWLENLQQNDTSSLSKEFIMGKFNPSQDPRFMIVPPAICSKSMYLQKQVVAAFRSMKTAAKLAGVDLKIISGTRNFWEQKAIWERKWTANVGRFGQGVENARHILKYSSMPGSSRHHWGTDIDINSLEPVYFRSGRGLTEINWLRNHAKEYGFCEVYSPRSAVRHVGYEPEAWHWSYMPLASTYLTYYKSEVSTRDFQGFYGSQWAGTLRIIEDYVQGINCLY